MTPDDRNINLVEFLNENEPGLKEFFKPEFAKGLASQSLVSQDNLVSITYPDSSAASKFIALYGFDDLYTMLPKNIRRLSFNNVGKEVFNLPIPDDIGDYTSLIGLHLSNCVTNLPDSVCKIKNLKFLSITDNPNLQSIPECLADAPHLTILNLKNSRTEGVVPESLKQRNDTDDHFHLYLN
jgi:Leucine-rich repeat (LRR) protein